MDRLVTQDDVHGEHQVTLVDGKRGGFARLGLGAKRDARACGLNHGDVVGAVADCHGVCHIDATLNRPIQQLDELGLLGHNVGSQLTGELAVDDFQAVGQAKIDARSGHDLVGDLVETAAHHADLPALAVCRAHKLQRAGGKCHALKGALEHALVQAGEQPHALLERLLKVKLAAHGAFGDLCHLLAYAGLLAQQVDDLLVDERGVDIHNDEACSHDGPFRVQLLSERSCIGAHCRT